MPEVHPHVAAYRRHRLACPGCGAVAWGPHPAHVVGGCGPRAQAACALLDGGHRLVKRAVAQVLGDLFGFPISPAAVCDLQARTAAAVEPVRWHRVRDPTLTHRGFRPSYPGWLRAAVRSLLASGAAYPCPKMAAACREIPTVEASLWTFDRAVRHAVCWRKMSDGTDSEAGSRLVERVLTVVAGCRQQRRNILTFLVDAAQADKTGTATPSLVPARATRPPPCPPCGEIQIVRNGVNESGSQVNLGRGAVGGSSLPPRPVLIARLNRIGSTGLRPSGWALRIYNLYHQ